MKVRAFVVAAVLATAATTVLVGCVNSRSPLAGAEKDSDVGASVAGPDHSSHHELPVVEPAGAAAPTRHTGPQGNVGQFVTDCALSHTAAVDPIVYPAGTSGDHGSDHDQGSGHEHGAGGHSHMHDFFGNTTTDSASTLKSLLEGGTTCQKQLDTAAYWAPQLLDHGEAVIPRKSTAYYRPAPGVDGSRLEAYPPDLRMIAGNAAAASPQSPDLAGWSCGTSSTQYSTPPNCPESAPLRAVITFPDCWDGLHTDSADHRSHMANSSQGLCPATHPIHVPQLTFAITYPIFGTGHDLELASGGIYGLHSDFINSWHQESLEQEINLCLHRDVVCALSSNRDEEALFSYR